MMDPLNLLESGKIKRYFRATKKLNTPGIISHITQRAAGKGKLFVEDKDYLIMLRFFKEIASNYELNVYCFCLMPNHVHFLISPQKPRGRWCRTCIVEVVDQRSVSCYFNIRDQKSEVRGRSDS